MLFDPFVHLSQAAVPDLQIELNVSDGEAAPGPLDQTWKIQYQSRGGLAGELLEHQDLHECCWLQTKVKKEMRTHDSITMQALIIKISERTGIDCATWLTLARLRIDNYWFVLWLRQKELATLSSTKWLLECVVCVSCQLFIACVSKVKREKKRLGQWSSCRWPLAKTSKFSFFHKASWSWVTAAIVAALTKLQEALWRLQDEQNAQEENTHLQTGLTLCRTRNVWRCAGLKSGSCNAQWFSFISCKCHVVWGVGDCAVAGVLKSSKSFDHGMGAILWQWIATNVWAIGGRRPARGWTWWNHMSRRVAWASSCRFWIYSFGWQNDRELWAQGICVQRDGPRFQTFVEENQWTQEMVRRSSQCLRLGGEAQRGQDLGWVVCPRNLCKS